MGTSDPSGQADDQRDTPDGIVECDCERDPIDGGHSPECAYYISLHGFTDTFAGEPVTDAALLSEAFKDILDPNVSLSGKIILNSKTLRTICETLGGYPPEFFCHRIVVVESLEGALLTDEQGKWLPSRPDIAGPGYRDGPRGIRPYA